MAEGAQPGVELRPLGLGEMLDRTFTLYRTHFWLFCGVMALPQAIRATVDVFAARAFSTMPLFGPTTPSDPRKVIEAFQATAGSSLLLGLIAFFIYGMAIGATTYCVSDVYQRRSVSIRTVYQQVARRAGALIGLFLMLLLVSAAIYFTVVFAAVFVAFFAGLGVALVSRVVGALLTVLIIIAGAVLGAWLLMRFAVALPVLLVEDKGVVESMSRSGVLTRGNRGRIFLALLVIWCIVLGVTAVFTMVPTAYTFFSVLRGGRIPIWAMVSNAILGGVAGTITGPFLAITLAVIYFDLRIRKEAFDLETLMAAPAATLPPPEAPQAPPAPLAP
ncbi:MAG TPA: hypothetical protein VFO34_00735 [Candidatus Acidoferrales bacterium]|nr:hypothetical protein [Candidatus Acidoferrales bacterium]